MTSVCFYFQIHQPFRLNKYSYFDIGNKHFYFDDQKNRAIIQKVSHKCYLPTNQLLLKLINEYKGDFKIAFSVTGTAIEQFKLYAPETLDSFKRLADTGCVEFLNETYFHSLAFLYSKEEFIRQIKMHRELIYQEFGQYATTFRNTELIYNNDIASMIESLGYQTIITEGTHKILDWRSPNFIYTPKNTTNLKLLLKNYQLSDDIAFRFSNKGWENHPLTSEKFASWIHNTRGNGYTINLFMDYETFGEHQWSDSGIFQFLETLPHSILAQSDFQFNTPHEVSQMYKSMGAIDVPHYISWADQERDLTAWHGNHLQNQSLDYIFKLEEQVYQLNNPELIHTWQTLLTSDHFYYMCTKWFSDGDVHKYFNPYDSPYEAFIIYQNVLSDLTNTFKTLAQ